MNDVSSPKNGFFSEGRWLFGLLCLITFLVAITTGHNVFTNAWLIFWYEAVFVVSFLSYRAMKGFPGILFPKKSVGFWLLSAWFISVTLSLVNSPYGLMTEWFAVSRYFQTFFHMIFMLCLLRFLSGYHGSFSPALLSIPVSILVLAVIFIGAWGALDHSQELGKRFWYIEPPFNAHIRITDFLATAASVILVPYFMYKEQGIASVAGRFLIIFLSVVAWGFLFWCGGRGGMLSAFSASVFFLIIFKVKKQPIVKTSLLVLLAILGGIFVAKLFSVFPWNGIGGAAERTIQHGGLDIYRLSNSRFDYWMSVWESLKETGSYALGLGSQGYCYMPSRIYAFQPHNLVFQFLAEWGIFGTLLFLSLLIMGVVRGFKNHVLLATEKLSTSAMAAGILLLALGVHSLVDGIFYHAQSSYYMALAFAIWMAPKGRAESDED